MGKWESIQKTEDRRWKFEDRSLGLEVKNENWQYAVGKS